MVARCAYRGLMSHEHGGHAHAPHGHIHTTDQARLTYVPVYFCPSRRSPGSYPTASISGDQNDDSKALHRPRSFT